MKMKYGGGGDSKFGGKSAHVKGSVPKPGAKAPMRKPSGYKNCSPHGRVKDPNYGKKVSY